MIYSPSRCNAAAALALLLFAAKFHSLAFLCAKSSGTGRKKLLFFFMGGKKLATSSQRLMDKGEEVYSMLEVGDTAAKCDSHPHHSAYRP